MKLGFQTALALAAALTFMSAAANAQSPVTGNLGVSIEIVNSCSVDVTGNVEFGAQGSLAGDVTATGQITVNCTQGHTYEIALNAGAFAGATVAERRMVGTNDPTETIKYALYQDATYTTLWGDTPEAETVSKSGTGVGDPISVYAKIKQTNTPPADTYSDTVTVTVSY